MPSTSRWLRDIAICETAWNPYMYYYMKAHTVFLQNVLGYTFQSTNCPAGRSFVSTEKTGTGGSFGGSDWIFTGSGFAQADSGKWIVICDNTNPRNGGIYPIRKVISTSQVEIDFRADPYCEWPTASTGITWWVYARDYQAPTSGDYVRLQSRHTTGWALEYTAGSTWFKVASIRVAIDGDWGGTKILPGGGYTTFIGQQRANGNLGWHAFQAEGDYDGEWLNLWQRNMGDSEQWACSGICIARITPLEPGHSNNELLLLAGATNNNYLCSMSFRRNYDGEYSLHPRVWCDARNAPLSAWWMQPSLGWAGNGFTEWQNREPNARIGDKFEIAQGSWLCVDETNASGQYQILGKVKGHWTSKDFMHSAGDYATAHRHLTLSRYSRKDLLMIQHGWIINWPGVTPQF